MLIAVAGGTGVVGSHVARLLRERGHDVRILARSTGVDLVTGAGLDAALRDVRSVIDVSNVRTTAARTAVDFFSASTSRLMAAEERAGVGHHVVLSIVGVDRIEVGYYLGKRTQEKVALTGPVPATILRTTQFHEFAGQMLARLRRGPIAPIPHMRTQPVAAREVAEALADLAVRPAAGRPPDLGGPEPHELTDLVRRLARARRERVLVVPVRIPGPGGRAMATGGLLPDSDARLGRQTFAEWLAAEAAGELRATKTRSDGVMGRRR